MKKLDTNETLANYVRNVVTKIITQEYHMVFFEWGKWITSAITSFKERHNIVIAKADKHNCVVIMDKTEYQTKMQSMLQDGPYKPLQIDPT